MERSAAVVEVVAAAEPRGQGRGHARVAPPEPPDVVAITAVPVRPAALPGKCPDLVEPGGIPGLGDQLGVAEQRVLGDPLDDRRLDQHVAVPVAAQDRGQIESESRRPLPRMTQFRRQSSRKLRTTGWSLLNVLPHPL